MKAHEFLERGIGHMVDRAKAYDSPEGERSMGATVEAFSAVTGISMTEEQGWLFMTLLKIVRSQQGAFKSDNYEDGAAYFGLMGEAASVEYEIVKATVENIANAPVTDQDPMAAIEWLPGMRWMFCFPAGAAFQCYGTDHPTTDELAFWDTDGMDLRECGYVRESWARANWRTSLRENPAFRDDPKTWEAGDVVQYLPTKECGTISRIHKVSSFVWIDNGLLTHSDSLALVRRSWEPDTDA